MKTRRVQSVKSINLCESVVQTVFDIVKAHAGELKVESRQNEGSMFIIQIPIN